jgi:hypothetical protein
MKYKKKLKKYNKAKKIVNSKLSWEAKYDLIFSDKISKKFNLNYYGPDTSYEEDVMAFMKALDSYMCEQKEINSI